MTVRFGTDGVRGVAGRDLTPEIALQVSTAAARVLGEAGVFGSGRRPRALVGRDPRASGEFLEAAVIAGLGMMYGPWLGGLVGGVGSTLAGLVAYAGGRWVGRPAVKLFAGDADLAKLSRFFARNGLWAIAFSRWMPLLPEAPEPGE